MLAIISDQRHREELEQRGLPFVLSDDEEPAEQGVYVCCNYRYDSFMTAVVHWRHDHAHVPRHQDRIRWFHPAQPCRAIADVSSTSHSLAARAHFYLASMEHFPRNPLKFRPRPLASTPAEFPDAYTAATALAYDFLAHVLSASREYDYFLDTFLEDHSFKRVRDHVDVLPAWASYKYPPEAAWTIHPPADIGTVADVVCPEPRCGSAYATERALALHLYNGHCVALQPPARLRCPLAACSETRQRSKSLYYHIEVAHAKKIFGTRGKKTFVCPVRAACGSFAMDQLIYHIVEHAAANQ